MCLLAAASRLAIDGPSWLSADVPRQSGGDPWKGCKNDPHHAVIQVKEEGRGTYLCGSFLSLISHWSSFILPAGNILPFWVASSGLSETNQEPDPKFRRGDSPAWVERQPRQKRKEMRLWESELNLCQMLEPNRRSSSPKPEDTMCCIIRIKVNQHFPHYHTPPLLKTGRRVSLARSKVGFLKKIFLKVLESCSYKQSFSCICSPESYHMCYLHTLRLWI